MSKTETTNADLPAFPVGVAAGPAGDVFHSGSFHGDGFTKREYAAIMAMQGMLAAMDGLEFKSVDHFAEKCVEAADALLAQLARSQGGR